MTVRRLVAAALTAGAVLAPAAPASATCYLGNVDICHKPTDPYTHPVTRPVVSTVVGVLNGPTVGPVYWTVVDAYTDAYVLVVCTALC